MSEVLCNVQGLKKYFPVREGILSRTVAHVHAVDDVTFEIRREETLGLVGESGCGKTTVGKCILRLIPSTAGKIVFEGRNLFELNKQQLQAFRRQTAMIFQDPYSSLNPRMTAGNNIGEPVTIHRVAGGQKKRDIVLELLEKVGLKPQHASRYPHEFSGGQMQRIAIARALALKPNLVVADEPVAALDVSIRAGILNLMKDLQNEIGLSYLFISHDLSVVRYLCDRVIVMYLGKLVEIGDTDKVFYRPLHPYTRALISAVPVPDPTIRREIIILPGKVPTPIDPPPGCRFKSRCPHAQPICSKEEPLLMEISSGHFVACHFALESEV
ncbi:MAG: ABC transporter ATP-binding protein [Desulfobacterales bacterium]|nr:ABC transporter ATP-binding protein [Desulfobacterales bacterium]